MKSFNYITTEEVLASVKSKLRSFDESGLLDESEMISNILYVLEVSRSSREYNKKLVLDIYDYKVQLPSDLDYIEIIYKCSECNPNPRKIKKKWYYGLPHTFTVKDYAKRVCYHKCDIIEDGHEEITRVISLETEEDEVQNFCNKEIISYKHTVPTSKLKDTCPNLTCTSSNFFNIKGNTLYFNFEEGHILLQYTGQVLDEEGYPMIEDNPRLINAIVDYLVMKELETIYYNSEADVQQRLQMARAVSNMSLGEIIAHKKMPSHKNMMAYAKAKVKGVQRFNPK